MFLVYDSCRKDSLVLSEHLDVDTDLALLGSVSVTVDDMLQRIAKHQSDPRIPLSLKLPLQRDKNQNMLMKTFEHLGKGVNMITNPVHFFANEPAKKEPMLVLNLAPIRFVCCLQAPPCAWIQLLYEVTPCRSTVSDETFCWQHDASWQIVDSGHNEQQASEADVELEGTTLTLLEMNSSHIPVIENAIARVNDYAKHNSKSSDIQNTPSIMYLVNSAASFKQCTLCRVVNTATARRSQSSEFR
jgi:hypothetical protein